MPTWPRPRVPTRSRTRGLARITASFVTSVAGPGGFPREALPEITFIGRSNVGKSSLINALTRVALARTSAAPGKTRLANYYRLQREGEAPFFLVDLPGYGYARGGQKAAAEFDALVRAYFHREGREGGSPVRGALLMLAFGLGTLPNLLLAGILLARLNEFVRRPAVRIASGLLVLGFGIYGLIGLMRLLHWI